MSSLQYSGSTNCRCFLIKSSALAAISLKIYFLRLLYCLLEYNTSSDKPRTYEIMSTVLCILHVGILHYAGSVNPAGGTNLIHNPPNLNLITLTLTTNHDLTLILRRFVHPVGCLFFTTIRHPWLDYDATSRVKNKDKNLMMCVDVN